MRSTRGTNCYTRGSGYRVAVLLDVLVLIVFIATTFALSTRHCNAGTAPPRPALHLPLASTQDVSGNGYRAYDYNTTPVPDRLGKPDGALAFVDSGRVIVPLPAHLQNVYPMTLTAWVWYSAPTDGEVNIAQRWRTNPYTRDLLWRLHLNERHNLALEFGETAHTITASRTLLPKTWYRVGVTWDGVSVKLYVNGLHDGLGYETQPQRQSTTNLVFGYHMPGYLDTIKYWGTALTNDQVTARTHTFFQENRPLIAGEKDGLKEYTGPGTLGACDTTHDCDLATDPLCENAGYYEQYGRATVEQHADGTGATCSKCCAPAEDDPDLCYAEAIIVCWYQ